MKSILILYNQSKMNAYEYAQNAYRLISKAKIQPQVMTSQEFVERDQEKISAEYLKQFEAIVVLGGDGTILGVARKIAHYPRPMMGINLGKFGFLTSSGSHELEEAITSLISNQYNVSMRYMLEARVARKVEGQERAEVVFKALALNEALFTLSRPGRVVEILVGEEHHPILAYRADGLIISTSTGSTGHSLSAGGPIVEPHLPALVITPVSPHSLFNRPLVVDGEKKLYIAFRENPHELVLILDGQVEFPLYSTDHVHIRRSPHQIPMISMPERTFAQILNLKFNLGSALYDYGNP
ncbi:MAG: NAD(+)/NADH kinase [bacterium]|jgi:NAD+ kinase